MKFIQWFDSGYNQSERILSKEPSLDGGSYFGRQSGRFFGQTVGVSILSDISV